MFCRVDPDVADAADRHAAIAHVAVQLQARHRPLEQDVVAGEIVLGPELADPDDEADQSEDQHQNEGADGDMAGPSLHGCSRSPSSRRGRAPARAVEVFPDPGMIVLQKFRHRADLDLLVHEHGDTVADRRQTVQIVGHHEDGQAQALLQAANQLVEGGGADRIEAGGRLVQEQDLRDRGPARGPGRPACSCRPRAPPGSCRRTRAAARPARSSGPSARCICGGRSVCSFIGTWMFCATVSELNSAPLWNSTPQRACSSAQPASLRSRRILAQHGDAAGRRPVQADDRAQQHRLAGARAADHAEHLAAPHVEIELVVHHLLAELGAAGRGPR